MIAFNDFLPQALRAAQHKFPGANLQLYNGEYLPDIPNLHYEYNFADPTIGVKVVVNTFNNSVNFIVMQTTNQFMQVLGPVTMPVTFTLQQAYDMAVQQGYKPNLDGAIVFLQDDRKLSLGAAYWFLREGSNTDWILVQVAAPHRIVQTTLQPVIPPATAHGPVKK